MWRVVAVVMLVGSVAIADADEPVPVPPATPAERPGESAPPAERGVEDAANEPPTVTPSESAPVQAIAPHPAPITNTVNEDETPPLSAGRLVGEFFVGGLFMAGGAIGGALLGETVSPEQQGCGFSPICSGGVVGAVAGLAFVTPLGVYMVGAEGNETGSLAATVGGSVIGTLVGLAPLAVNDESALAAIPLLVGPIAGAMIGFNATRRHERAQKPRAVAPVARVTGDRIMFGAMARF